MSERPSVSVEVAPDVIKLKIDLHLAQASPVPLCPLARVIRRIQHVLLARDAVEVPAHKKAAISW